MGTRCEIRIRSDYFERPGVSDEQLFRDLARKIVSEMPLDNLHKLINLTKVDPNSDETIKQVQSGLLPYYELDEIYDLRMQNVILYYAEIYLP